ncbi:hypothetical protein VPH35_097759 [Triticum aestivum]|uniref:Uncharacterized protein n=1 Tax=Aegilops tauschii TaxID=37682 RepID=M8AWV7_AEGTA
MDAVSLNSIFTKEFGGNAAVVKAMVVPGAGRCRRLQGAILYYYLACGTSENNEIRRHCEAFYITSQRNTKTMVRIFKDARQALEHAEAGFAAPTESGILAAALEP